jgi:phosphatidylglycerophosphate synthase
MSLPAIIHCDEDAASLPLAGLSLLDRLVVSLHRAGVGSITLVRGQKPQTPKAGSVLLRRTAAMGIVFKEVDRLPECSGPALMLSSCLLAHASDLKRVLDQGGRLATGEGDPLPVALLSAVSSSWEDELNSMPLVKAGKPAIPVTDMDSARRAEKLLWRSLTSSSDGTVDRYFNRPVGRVFSKMLVHTPISPNQVSVVATILGLISAWLFSRGHGEQAFWGALLLQFSAVIDCVDGDLARVMYKESTLGKWLDIGGDQVVHLGLFAGIGLGLAEAGSSAPVLALAGSAVAGVVISFMVVVRGLTQPEDQRNTRLQKMIDATTNRDFSVLLIILVLVGRLEWFLWMTAIGVHVFWVLALGVQVMGRPSPGKAGDLSP